MGFDHDWLTLVSAHTMTNSIASIGGRPLFTPLTPQTSLVALRRSEVVHYSRRSHRRLLSWRCLWTLTKTSVAIFLKQYSAEVVGDLRRLFTFLVSLLTVPYLFHQRTIVWGWRAVACDILCRGRHFVSRATFCVEGDILCRGRHSVSRATFCVEGDILCRGRHSVSRATFCVEGDITCRSQAEPAHPPGKQISLMTIDVILAVNCFPGERGK
jgi:hypothetical protein